MRDGNVLVNGCKLAHDAGEITKRLCHQTDGNPHRRERARKANRQQERRPAELGECRALKFSVIGLARLPAPYMMSSSVKSSGVVVFTHCCTDIG